MTDNKNKYAKYRIPVECPVYPGKVNMYEYDMQNPEEVRKYADALEKNREELKKNMMLNSQSFVQRMPQLLLNLKRI